MASNATTKSDEIILDEEGCVQDEIDDDLLIEQTIDCGQYESKGGDERSIEMAEIRADDGDLSSTDDV